MQLPKDLSNFCTFYIIRHGQTEWNVLRKLQGQTDVPLTASGIQEAELLARTLSDTQFDIAFSSDLLRAKHTAEIIALEKKIAIQTTQLLREGNYGKKEGTLISDLAEIEEQYIRMSDEERKKFRFDSTAESDEEVVARFITFLREVAVAHPGKNVLTVTHGGVMRALLIHIGFGTYTTFGHDKRIRNGSYIVLLSDGVDFFIQETVGIDIPSTLH